MKHSKYSAVIIGGGIAGLYAALKIAEQSELKDGLLLITKSKLGESNSRYAQGGIVAVLSENKKDSTSLHISDTLRAGAGLSDFNVTKFISENSDAVVKDLLTIKLADITREIISRITSENPQFRFDSASNTLNMECGNVGNDTSIIINQIQNSGGVIERIYTQGTNLESIYLKLTGKELRD